MTIDRLQAEALELPEPERVRLANRLIASLSESDDPTDERSMEEWLIREDGPATESTPGNDGTRVRCRSVRWVAPRSRS